MDTKLVKKLFEGKIDMDDKPELSYREAVRMLREGLSLDGVDRVVDAVLGIYRSHTGDVDYDEIGDFDTFAHILRILAPWISDDFGCANVSIPDTLKRCDIRDFAMAYRNNRLLGWEE
jgi:hypothetical protein